MMSETTFYNDHTTRVLRRLFSQFSEATNLKGILQAFAVNGQNIEDVFQSLVEDRTLAAAEGVQLDGLGDLVGEPRSGRDDAAYRTAILARIAANVSRGTPENVLNTFRIAVGSDDCMIDELFPLELILYTDSAEIPVNLHDVVRSAAPATTGLVVIITTGGLALSGGAFTSEYNADVPVNFATFSEWDDVSEEYYYEGSTIGELVTEEE